MKMGSLHTCKNIQNLEHFHHWAVIYFAFSLSGFPLFYGWSLLICFTSIPVKYGLPSINLASISQFLEVADLISQLTILKPLIDKRIHLQIPSGTFKHKFAIIGSQMQPECDSSPSVDGLGRLSILM